MGRNMGCSTKNLSSGGGNQFHSKLVFLVVGSIELSIVSELVKDIMEIVKFTEQ